MPENAASQPRAVLPPGLAGRLDLDRLTPAPASFVDETLKWRYCDLLFTAPLDGRDAYVYLLIEHQSTADPLMAFRMLRYVTRIWDHHLRDHPRARHLPAVIPLVVHHGPSPWTSPVQLQDLIDAGPATRQAIQDCLPRFEYLLDDLSGIDHKQLRDRQLTPAALITLLLLETGPDAQEAYMTTAEMLRAEGEARSRAQALVEMLTASLADRHTRRSPGSRASPEPG